MTARTYQFIRLSGYRRGPSSKRNTLGSILAEGLRKPTHISHLPGAPRYEVEHLDGPVSDPEMLGAWIEQQMSVAKNPMTLRGERVLRGVRKDAVAIGTIIASLPETLDKLEPQRFSQFAEDTTAWAREFLAARDMQLHFRLEHLDELYPHIHLWFTPKGVEEGTGGWSFMSVLGSKKGFLHNFQTNYFDEVGHKYADMPSRSMEDRQKRLPRYLAIQNRDAAKLDVVRRIREGDLSVLGDIHDRAVPVATVGKMLSNLSDDEVESLPAFNQRLAALRMENAQHEKLQQDLEAQIKELRNDNAALNDKVSKWVVPAPALAEPSLTEHMKSLEEHYSNFVYGARKFATDGVWGKIVSALLKSAHRNMNRAYQVSQPEWEQLVVEDALPHILPKHSVLDVREIDYWLEQVSGVLKEYGIHNYSKSPFKAFDGLEEAAQKILDGSDETSEMQEVARFRSVAAKKPALSDDPWAELLPGH